MSPLTTGVIGAAPEDLRGISSGRQIDVPVRVRPRLHKRLRRLAAALAGLLAALLRLFALGRSQSDVGDRRGGIDLARAADVDALQRIHQEPKLAVKLAD